LLMGAHGGIGSFYNIAPKLILDIFESAKRNDWTQARRHQDRINDLITITLRYPPIPALKAILGWNGIACGASLGPVGRIAASDESRLREELEIAGFDFASELQAVS
jgi:N-acetylneuraminate lyase